MRAGAYRVAPDPAGRPFLLAAPRVLEALRDRIALARVFGDPWAHAPLQQAAERSLSAAGPATTWRRLDAAPQTVPGLLALFGWPQDRDPVEEFARRGVPYEGGVGLPQAGSNPRPDFEQLGHRIGA